jgi:hypothetical protein
VNGIARISTSLLDDTRSMLVSAARTLEEAGPTIGAGPPSGSLISRWSGAADSIASARSSLHAALPDGSIEDAYIAAMNWAIGDTDLAVTTLRNGAQRASVAGAFEQVSASMPTSGLNVHLIDEAALRHVETAIGHLDAARRLGPA